MKKVIVFLSVIGLLALLYGFYLFNKKTESLQNVEPDFVITADELYMDFSQNEKSALKKYEGKVLQVTGKIIMVTQTDSISNILLQSEQALLGGVNCSFNKLDDVLQTEDLVSVKGQCQGFITSVVLNNCTIIK